MNFSFCVVLSKNDPIYSSKSDFVSFRIYSAIFSNIESRVWYVCGWLYIPDGESVKFLVDTGAYVAIINTGVYRRRIRSPEEKSSETKMADGKFICAKGITTLKVILASVQHGFWIFDIGEDINRLLGFYFLKADVFLMSKPASLN